MTGLQRVVLAGSSGWNIGSRFRQGLVPAPSIVNATTPHKVLQDRLCQEGSPCFYAFVAACPFFSHAGWRRRRPTPNCLTVCQARGGAQNQQAWEAKQACAKGEREGPGGKGRGDGGEGGKVRGKGHCRIVETTSLHTFHGSGSTRGAKLTT